MRNLQITNSITNRETASTECYFNEIGKTSLVSPDEEVRLAQKIRAGDTAALDKLVKANLRFVVSIAKKYQHQGLPLGDLINEGNLGLIKAAGRFDETRGFKFISFAVWWIRQSILEAIRENTRMIRLPANHINILTKINRLSGELEGCLERQSTYAELAELAEVSVEKVSDTHYFSGRTISYDTPLTSEDDYALVDKLASMEPLTDHLITSGCDEVKELLNRLTSDERLVIEYSFGLRGERELNNREIAEKMGCYPEKVRLIAKSGFQKLKNTTATAGSFACGQ